MLAPLEHRLQAGAQRKCRLAGAGAATDGDNPYVWVHQQVQSNTLLRGASLEAKGIDITTYELDHAISTHAPQRGLRTCRQGQAAVHWQVLHGGTLFRFDAV